MKKINIERGRDRKIGKRKGRGINEGKRGREEKVEKEEDEGDKCR